MTTATIEKDNIKTIIEEMRRGSFSTTLPATKIPEDLKTHLKNYFIEKIRQRNKEGAKEFVKEVFEESIRESFEKWWEEQQFELRAKQRVPITDPSRLLEDFIHKETVQEIIARAQKDPWLSVRDTAEELGVHFNTIYKYIRFGLIEAKGDRYFGGSCIKQSEVERIKSNSNWLKEFGEIAKDKPFPTPLDIFYKKRMEVFEEIEDLSKYREPLNPVSVKKNHPRLYYRARKYYGSWHKAIEGVGLHPSQVYKNWKPLKWVVPQKPKMTDEEKELKRELLLLKIKNLFKEGRFDNKTRRKFDNAVWNYFGGWKKIYVVLGIKRIRKRTKKNIVAEIQSLYNRGIRLSFTNMIKNHCALLSSACIYFGNWPNAIKAAGLDYSKIRIRNRRARKEYPDIKTEEAKICLENATTVKIEVGAYQSFSQSKR